MEFKKLELECPHNAPDRVPHNAPHRVPHNAPTWHSGGNDRFCARIKTDISAFSSGLQGHLRSCHTSLDSSRRLLSKNVRHDLVRPRRPELEAEMSVFNLAQKRSFPPLCHAGRAVSKKRPKPPIAMLDFPF
jgi:hypothetical protein